MEKLPRTAKIEVLHGGHVACQEQYNIIPMGQNFHSNAKHFHCSWHATWPPCKTSIGRGRRSSPIWVSEDFFESKSDSP